MLYIILLWRSWVIHHKTRKMVFKTLIVVYLAWFIGGKTWRVCCSWFLVGGCLDGGFRKAQFLCGFSPIGWMLTWVIKSVIWVKDCCISKNPFQSSSTNASTNCKCWGFCVHCCVARIQLKKKIECGSSSNTNWWSKKERELTNPKKILDISLMKLVTFLNRLN